MRRWAMPIVLLLVVAAAGLTLYVAIRVAEQRDNTILVECRDQNGRHANTVHELDVVLLQALHVRVDTRQPTGALEGQLIAAIKRASHARGEQIAASHASTLLLINALAPNQNCQRVLAKLSKT